MFKIVFPLASPGIIATLIFSFTFCWNEYLYAFVFLNDKDAVGLGIEEFSGAPSAIPVVKEIVRELDSGDVAADARAACEAGTAAEVHAIGAARLREAGLLEHPDIGSWLRDLVEEAEQPA